MDFWYLPIGDEIFERWEHDIHAVQKCVAQKQKKEFLIVVAHTIVHPRAVMVHLQKNRSKNMRFQSDYDRATLRTHVPHTEQWCALSGLIVAHFSQYRT